MPLRSRGQLLAGIGALLGLCTAGAGCQSTQANRDNYATQPASQNQSLALFSFRHAHRDPTDQPASPMPADSPSPVVMLRPVAIRAVSDDQAATNVSAWHTVQHAPSDFPSGVVPVGAQVVQGMPGPLDVGSPTTVDLPPVPITEFPAPAGGPPPGMERKVTPVVHLGPPKPIHPPLLGAPVPKEFGKRSLSAYVVEPPDILLVQATQAIALKTQPLEGSHLVRPDGTIGLGIYGDVYVAGKTLEQIRDAVAQQLKERASKDLTIEQIKQELQVDVLAYNSKFYYIITDGGGYGQQVYRLPVTGNEMVLDAISQIGGLPLVASKKKIWVARATPFDCCHPKILPVDWRAITMYGCAATNYQLFPGDRLYVQSDCLIRADSWLAKILNPLDRFFGATLLGASAVNQTIAIQRTLAK